MSLEYKIPLLFSRVYMTLLIIYRPSLHIIPHKNAISSILFLLFDQRIPRFSTKFFLGVMAQWSGKLMFILVELKSLQINNFYKNPFAKEWLICNK